MELTVFFSGPKGAEALGPNARLAQLPPIFSTAQLKFLPYVPDHTDLAPYHPALAGELADFDVIHTTDAFFAFARTAEAVSRRRGVPLVTSFHTDTPSYARIFTRQTIEQRLGGGWAARKLIDDWKLPEHQARRMRQRQIQHLRRCDYVLATRGEDHALAESIVGRSRVSHLRLGVDKQVFGPHRAQRAEVEAQFGLPRDQILVLFVGRLDVGKNIHTLIEAIGRLRLEGLPLHLVTAGVGPAERDVRRNLGPNATVAGFVDVGSLARLYASVDLTAASSEVEIHGMVGVEALTSGCPVLVSSKSGVAPLFHHTPAMRVVDGGPAAWTEALRRIALLPRERAAMRAEALDYAGSSIASWNDVLADDLYPVWREAAEAPADANLTA